MPPTYTSQFNASCLNDWQALMRVLRHRLQVYTSPEHLLAAAFAEYACSAMLSAAPLSPKIRLLLISDCTCSALPTLPVFGMLLHL